MTEFRFKFRSDPKDQDLHHYTISLCKWVWGTCLGWMKALIINQWSDTGIIVNTSWGYSNCLRGISLNKNVSCLLCFSCESCRRSSRINLNKGLTWFPQSRNGTRLVRELCWPNSFSNFRLVNSVPALCRRYPSRHLQNIREQDK